MTPEILDILVNWAGRAIAGPTHLAKSISIATLAIAENIIVLFDRNLIGDIRKLKNELIEQVKATTDLRRAEAQEKLAQAKKQFNEAEIHKRRDKLAQLEREQKEAEAAKTKAEAEAIEKDAETRRQQAIAEAEQRVIDSLIQLRINGAEVLTDPDELEALIRRMCDKEK